MKTDPLKTRTIRLLTEHNVTPDTAMGQHFLIDSTILRKIIALVDPKPQETIVEIGAGLGTLTRELAKKTGIVIAIEKDRRLEPALRKALSGRKNVEVVIGNALALLDRFRPDKIVSNTPYLIAEPLVQKLFTLPFTEAILTLPAPFVDILNARTADKRYSSLSLFSQAFLDMTIHFPFPKDCTYPEAPVDGLVVTICHRQNCRSDPAFFVIKQLYLRHTKKLRNALKEALIDLHHELFRRPFTQNQARAVIERMGLTGDELELHVRETHLNTFKTILSTVDRVGA